MYLATSLDPSMSRTVNLQESLNVEAEHCHMHSGLPIPLFNFIFNQSFEKDSMHGMEVFDCTEV